MFLRNVAWLFNRLYGIVFWKTELFIITAVKTSDPKLCSFLLRSYLAQKERIISDATGLTSVIRRIRQRVVFCVLQHNDKYQESVSPYILGDLCSHTKSIFPVKPEQKALRRKDVRSVSNYMPKTQTLWSVIQLWSTNRSARRQIDKAREMCVSGVYLVCGCYIISVVELQNVYFKSYGRIFDLM
jgi:hypothetical protein